MKKSLLEQRLAVCSWSLYPANPQELVAKLHASGIHRVQMALDPLRESPEVWSQTEALFRQDDITIVSGMFGCAGEDYSTLENHFWNSVWPCAVGRCTPPIRKNLSQNCMPAASTAFRWLSTRCVSRRRSGARPKHCFAKTTSRLSRET